ncbi:PREDICTED: protein PTCD3 homolog, mitochondrial [Habropoda laboriosa]|uniref:protein PTCD3 homolog, mitochondrial n=1 Tax=Habropoda laboriosa TaxID=597456 RepID=UPI00083DB8D4|nr:PREDICTED: protein PTCD3 homolog, mitochondrial [Habropoda laboriosa]
MMNHLKSISQRNSWCQLKRLQSSLSSVSNSKIQIPARVERGPTDILNALNRTVPSDPIKIDYVYHDDPFLLPTKKQDFRKYTLSYEAGIKAAMWIHEEHGDLFPKHLSEPEIQAFKSFPTYTDESQVSEELLLQVISQCRISEAVHIYKVLKNKVSNEAKQSLLELLCFHNDQTSGMQTNFYFERFYHKIATVATWKYSAEIDELYEFLLKQDSLTAAAAYNAMICGLVKCSKPENAWQIFNKCSEADVPLNVTSYNSALLAIPAIMGKKNASKIQHVYDILRVMNKKGVKPNVKTLNAALRVFVQPPLENCSKYVKKILVEYKRLNIQFSLATYYYIILPFHGEGKSTHQDFLYILDTIKDEHFTIQDSADIKFFPQAMSLAYFYNDRSAGDQVHKLLHTGNNDKFLATETVQTTYYSTYILLLLATSTVDQFFYWYTKFVPSNHVPNIRLFTTILNNLELHVPEVVVKYILRIWSDLYAFHPKEMSLKVAAMRLMNIDILPAVSPLRTAFTNAALSWWKDIKEEIDEKLLSNSTRNWTPPIETNVTGCIAKMLLQGGYSEETIEVLQYTVKELHLFVPTMREKQVLELFDRCILAECIEAALLLLEYSVIVGFPHTVKMCTRLQTLPELTDNDRDRLINLVGVDALNVSDTTSKEIN